MNKITVLVTLVCLAILSGCSSTPDMSSIDKEYQLIERQYAKKPLISDLHLKAALLDRPVPEDQKMMLAFAKQRELLQQQRPELAYVSSVAIRGSKEQDKDISYQTAGYAGLKVNEFVATDANAITVAGPK